ncbi:O-antigen ligase family protein [Patescibacteria group bacterium]|nr:O-antigen ligase family protein [Patescibacteria group bacterium]
MSQFPEKTFKLAFLGMAVAIPLLLNPFGFFPFEADKIFLFRIIVSIMLFVWLLRIGSFQNLKTKLLNFFEEVRWLDLRFLFLLLTAVYGLSIIFSIAPAESFFGSPHRQFGFITILFFFLFFWLFNNSVNEKLFANFLKINLFTAFIIGSYAILQHFGIDFWPAGYVETIKGTHIIRSISTIGNPNYLGAFIAMTLPFTYLSIIIARGKQKILPIVIFLIQITSLYFTYNRGGWLAACGGLVCLVILQLVRQNRPTDKNFRFKTIAQLTFIIAIFGIFFFAPPDQGGRLRQTDIGVGNDGGSMFIRLQDYKFALEKIPEKILFGYGPETYQYLAETRIISEEESKIDNRLSDRVHNFFLDNLISIGFCGLLIIILIFISVFRSSAKLLLNNETDIRKKQMIIAANSSLIAYLIAMQLHFDTITTSFILFFNFALIHSIAKEHKKTAFIPEKTSKPMFIFATAILLICLAFNLSQIFYNL